MTAIPSIRTLRGQSILLIASGVMLLILAGLQLVPIAIGKGAAAGVACATSLRGHRTTGAAPAPAPPTRLFTAR